MNDLGIESPVGVSPSASVGAEAALLIGKPAVIHEAGSVAVGSMVEGPGSLITEVPPELRIGKPAVIAEDRREPVAAGEIADPTRALGHPKNPISFVAP